MPVFKNLYFYTVAPAGSWTRGIPVGPLGGPALAAGLDRTFVVAGTCGTPGHRVGALRQRHRDAATAVGNLRMYPGGTRSSRVDTQLRGRPDARQ